MSSGASAETSSGRIAVRFPARDFSRDWRRYNLVANYMGEYASYFSSHKDRAENVISSIFYELLEHMASISSEDAELAVKLARVEGKVLFEIATSDALRESVAHHRELVAELGGVGLNAMYRRLLESVPEEGGTLGELGLAMIAHDYRAALTTRIDPPAAVTLSASIDQEEISP